MPCDATLRRSVRPQSSEAGCPAGFRMAVPPQGRLAQLVEHLVYTERVGGSSPTPPTTTIATIATVPVRVSVSAWLR